MIFSLNNFKTFIKSPCIPVSWRTLRLRRSSHFLYGILQNLIPQLLPSLEMYQYKANECKTICMACLLFGLQWEDYYQLTRRNRPNKRVLATISEEILNSLIEEEHFSARLCLQRCLLANFSNINGDLSMSIGSVYFVSGITKHFSVTQG